MDDVPARNTPMLAGWVMAAGFGAAAAGVSWVALSMSGMGAAFVGSVIFAGTGIILGLPARDAAGSGPEALPMDPEHDRTAAGEAAPAPHMPEAPPAPVARAAAAAAAGLPTPAPAAGQRPLAEPVAVPPANASAAPAVASRPAGLATARDGKADDLKIIKGIGPKLEQLCHRLGYYHFDQVAAWTEAEVAWVDDNLEGFRGRVTRDRWVPQAKAILAHGQDEFLRRLDAGEAF
jgi:NADH-quinone oxidoreductase subunit E